MLSIGIVGLPNVGKSTLFNALTNRSVPAENYPFCTIEPSVGIVGVPDKRLTELSRLSGSAKTIPAAIEFTDIAGLVAGASKGEGLGNQFLSHIREVDAIAEVVRVFKDSDITHVSGAVNPLHDIEVINLELMLADFQTVSKRRASLVKEMRGGDKSAKTLDGALARIEAALDAGKLASTVPLSLEERPLVRGLGLLSMKPILYVLNTKNEHSIPEDLKKFLEKENHVTVDAAFERDIAASPKEERAELRAGLGVSESALDALIRESYAALGLITFFTTGPDETRGWTIKEGSTAKEAGAAIHTDFRDKFIRAEVVSYEDLMSVGSHSTGSLQEPEGSSEPRTAGQAYAAAREKGLVRTEGKEYIVKDGDVIEFKI